MLAILQHLDWSALEYIRWRYEIGEDREGLDKVDRAVSRPSLHAQPPRRPTEEEQEEEERTNQPTGTLYANGHNDTQLSSNALLLSSAQQDSVAPLLIP